MPNRVWTKNLPILIVMFTRLGHFPQILKLAHSVEHLIRNISMQKVCKKPAVKTSFIPFFNLVISLKQRIHVWDFWKKLFLKETMKKITWFFPLHPVTFYGENFEKQKYVEQVTSLFFVYQSICVARHTYKYFFFGLKIGEWRTVGASAFSYEQWGDSFISGESELGISL